MAVCAFNDNFVQTKLIEFGQTIDDELIDTVVQLLSETPLNNLYVIVHIGNYNVLAS